MEPAKKLEVYNNTGFKDGDDGDGGFLENFSIDCVDNGYILTTTFQDGTEHKEVFHEIQDVFESIQETVEGF